MAETVLNLRVHTRAQLAAFIAKHTAPVEAERDAALAALAALHQGEEPDTDPLAEPTPAQWLWRWNRATPEQRLEVAALFMENAAQAERCRFLGHEARLAEHDARKA